MHHDLAEGRLQTDDAFAAELYRPASPMRGVFFVDRMLVAVRAPRHRMTDKPFAACLG